jgi:hypothetical protein
MLIYVIKARTSTQHKLLPWSMEFNNIQIFGFRYVDYRLIGQSLMMPLSNITLKTMADPQNPSG